MEPLKPDLLGPPNAPGQPRGLPVEIHGRGNASGARNLEALEGNVRLRDGESKGAQGRAQARARGPGPGATF